MEHLTGIGPAYQPWEGRILPLNYRLFSWRIFIVVWRRRIQFRHITATRTQAVRAPPHTATCYAAHRQRTNEDQRLSIPRGGMFDCRLYPRPVSAKNGHAGFRILRALRAQTALGRIFLSGKRIKALYGHGRGLESHPTSLRRHTNRHNSHGAC